jgi:hypothetical protein
MTKKSNKKSNNPDIKKILDDLMYGGSTTKTVEICGGRISATFRNMTVNDQLTIENSMKNIDGIPAYILHQYSLKILSNMVETYGKHNFSKANPKEVEKFLTALPGPVIDELISAQNEFEKEIKKAITSDNIEENFSKTGSIDEE